MKTTFQQFQGIDTRALVRKLRISGAMRGVLCTEILDDQQLVAGIQDS